MIASFFAFLSSDPSLISYIDAGRRKDMKLFQQKSQKGERQKEMQSLPYQTEKEKVEMYVDTFIHEKV